MSVYIIPSLFYYYCYYCTRTPRALAAAAAAASSLLSRRVTHMPQRRSKAANLTLPASRVARILRATTGARRASPGASLYATAVVEYLTCELLETAGVTALHSGASAPRITARHLKLAIAGDDELCALIGDVILPKAGAVPHLEPALLPATARK